MNDMNFDERLKLDNFSQPTTYLNDYRLYAPQKIIKHKWPKDTIEKPTKPPAEFHETDIETFYPFKKELHVPFNLLWHPRPILETDPKRPYPKDLKPREDVDREEVIKTRPRLYMSPAVSLDDVEEKEMREMLCKGVYQTELRRAEEEVWKYLQKSKRDVFETVLDADHGIEYDFDPYPPLPEAWRKAGIKWDNQQKRALVDPTKQFWLNTKIE